MEKILITGGSGRIGRDLKTFFKKYYNIIEFKHGKKLSKYYFKNVKALIHLAALTPRKNKNFSLNDYIESNVNLTKQVLFYASKYMIKTVIIPTSWSWVFKIGYYQYSKLLQEKIAREYKSIGLRVILLELPEVIHYGYEGVISVILNKIKNKQTTTVDRINIKTITTKDIAIICRYYIEKKDLEANKLYKNSIKTFDLYEYIKNKVKQKFPNKLKYLKKGKSKIKAPITNKNKTIIFPKLE